MGSSESSFEGKVVEGGVSTEVDKKQFLIKFIRSIPEISVLDKTTNSLTTSGYKKLQGDMMKIISKIKPDNFCENLNELYALYEKMYLLVNTNNAITSEENDRQIILKKFDPGNMDVRREELLVLKLRDCRTILDKINEKDQIKDLSGLVSYVNVINTLDDTNEQFDTFIIILKNIFNYIYLNDTIITKQFKDLYNKFINDYSKYESFSTTNNKIYLNGRNFNLFNFYVSNLSSIVSLNQTKFEENDFLTLTAILNSMKDYINDNPQPSLTSSQPSSQTTISDRFILTKIRSEK